MKKTIIAIVCLVILSVVLSGCQIPAGGFVCTQDNVNIVLVTDTSGSMYGARLTTIQTVMKDFASAILTNSKNKIAVVNFGTDANTIVSLTNDINSINAGINGMSASGNTCTGCGIKEAISLLSASTTNKNYIIVFSDGMPNKYISASGVNTGCADLVPTAPNDCTNYAVTQAGNAKNQVSAKVYSVAVQVVSGSFQETFMTSIATAGNGKSFNTATMDGVPEIYANIVNEVCVNTCDVASPTYCTKGAQRCGNTGVETCRDTNADTCGDAWQVTTACASGTICNNLQCVCQSDACSFGQKWCEGSGYKECVKDANGCNVISGINSCLSGQVCSGGVCGCPSATCTVGSKQCVGDKYQECQVWSGVCPTWGTLQNCPTMMTCSAGKCVCPTSTSKIGDKQCDGNGYKVFQVYGSDNCPTWGTTIPCDANEICNSGICGCPSSSNNVGDRRCTAAASYQEFNVRGSDKCPTWSESIPCPSGKTCSGGVCSCPTTTYKLGDTKCIGTASYQIWSVYTGTCPSWGTAINCPTNQICANGLCSCPTNQCTAGDTRCNANTAEECQVSGNGCTSWVTSSVCGADEVCQKQSPAACYKYFDSVEIITEPEYNFDDEIDVGVKVTTQVIGLSGIKVYPELIADGKIVEKFPEPIILFNNEARFSFKPLGTYYSNVQVKLKLMANDAQIIATKDIVVKRKLSLSLSNTPPNYVTQPVKVEVTVQPAGISYTLSDILLLDPAGYQVQPDSITISQVLFTPRDVGVYTLTVEASSTTFTAASKQIMINVNTKAVSINIFLDGKDITTIPDGYVNTGTHTLKIQTIESGNVPRDLDSIDLYVIPPEGEVYKTKINFVKTADGEVSGTVNFPADGRDYMIKGYLQIYGDDVVEPLNRLTNIQFKTVGCTGDDCNVDFEIDWTIVGIVAVVLIALVVVGIFMLRKKK